MKIKNNELWRTRRRTVISEKSNRQRAQHSALCSVARSLRAVIYSLHCHSLRRAISRCATARLRTLARASISRIFINNALRHAPARLSKRINNAAPRNTMNQAGKRAARWRQQRKRKYCSANLKDVKTWRRNSVYCRRRIKHQTWRASASGVVKAKQHQSDRSKKHRSSW